MRVTHDGFEDIKMQFIISGRSLNLARIERGGGIPPQK